MKKIPLLMAAGVAALALASCSQDETALSHSGASLKFRPAVGGVTRGVVTTQANLNQFKVTSFLTGSSANYFTDLAVNGSSGGTVWNTAQVYYWPGAGTLNFYAYAPSDVTAVSVTPGSQKINSFSPEAAVASQKDVVVAYNSGTKAANEASGVALAFKHILSQVQVNAKCSDATVQVKVLGVKLCQIPSTANFTFPASVVTGPLPQSHWSAPATAKDYSTKLTSAVTLDATSKNVTASNFMLIPQQLTPWSVGTSADGAYISVLCQIVKGGAQLFPAAAGKYAYAAVPVSTNWQPGKKYTYTLNFLGSGGAGNTDPTPTNPDDPADPNVDPGIAPGGTPVLGGPIKFTVTVDAWDDLPEEPLSL